MASRGLTIKATIAWWLPLYLWAIKWFYVVTGKEPDWDRVGHMVKRAMRLTLNGQNLGNNVTVIPGPAHPSYPPMQDEYYERKG